MQVMNRDSEFLRRLISLNIREIVISLFVAVANLVCSYLNFSEYYFEKGDTMNKIMLFVNGTIGLYFLFSATRTFTRNRELREELKQAERSELTGNP